jgi:hypothetical protein
MIQPLPQGLLSYSFHVLFSRIAVTKITRAKIKTILHLIIVSSPLLPLAPKTQPQNHYIRAEIQHHPEVQDRHFKNEPIMESEKRQQGNCATKVGCASSRAEPRWPLADHSLPPKNQSLLHSALQSRQPCQCRRSAQCRQRINPIDAQAFGDRFAGDMAIMNIQAVE